MTHDVNNEWHVFAGGRWHAIMHDGYAPVCAEIDGHMVRVEYRHLALGCTDRPCATLAVTQLV